MNSKILEDWLGDIGHMMIRSHVTITETQLAGRRQMMIPELKLTKKVTGDEEATGFMLPRIVTEKPPEVERRVFYVVSADIEAYGHMGSCPGYALLTSQGEATKSCRNAFRERVGSTVERILAGEARMESVPTSYWRQTPKPKVPTTSKRQACVHRGAS